METANPLNVYSGPDSLIKYYDPDFQPPLPLVEIPNKLNPFREDGVRIYAKMMSCLPANNVKSLPALNMLQNGVTPETRTVIEYSSGSTVISLSVLARVLYNIEDVRAFLSNKTSETKIKMMRFFGLNITLFGGPAQPEPKDPRGGIQKAEQLGLSEKTILNPNQYENEANPGSHIKWTGPQIVRQLPDINVFATGLGTAGTMTGIGTYLKKEKPSVYVVGVCTAPGDRVPGPRSYSLLASLKFPWREAIDTVEHVGSPDSYRLSMELSREGLICGPSSGFNLQGLFQFLEKRKKEGTLKDLAGEDGEIKCVFICCDLPYQYLSEYFEKLGEEHFHPIVNRELSKVDQYRYDEAWELESSEAFAKLYEELPIYDKSSHKLQCNAVLLDLRSETAYETWHLPGATNMPLQSSRPGQPSPFSEPKLLQEKWCELDKIFSPNGTPYSSTLLAGLRNRLVGIVCDDGDTARIASSVLQAKGIEAYSIAGGVRKVGPRFI
ncbi:tryptophan synthase beta subunit-like PLP-dependent enzyme [Geopyxis carbonaria]|nr:tryptophan synthase beta subunit-like PLP-dependent enzyme [Geopyxis carbonaria]